jgi:hypothetical protein
MSTTAQNCIDYALERSSLSDVQLVNVPAALALLANEEKKAYITAARLDPEYFGTSGDTATRASYTASWSLDAAPGDVAAVSRAYAKTIVGTVSGVVAGTKINLVDMRWPGLDLAPRAYVRGRKIVPHETELGTGNSNMVTVVTVWYSQLPTAPTTVASTISLPDEWRDLLVLPLAKMFCVRDHRVEEAAVFDAELKGLIQTFAEAVLSYGHGVRRPLPSVPAIPLTGK